MDNNFDFSELNKRLKDISKEKNNTEQIKAEKVERLIILLHQIEKELTKVESNLHRLWQEGYKNNQPVVQSNCAEKIQKIENLKTKIQKTRLNLNIRFN